MKRHILNHHPEKVLQTSLEDEEFVRIGNFNENSKTNF